MIRLLNKWKIRKGRQEYPELFARYDKLKIELANLEASIEKNQMGDYAQTSISAAQHQMEFAKQELEAVRKEIRSKGYRVA
ncbi:TPA: hypothetical protein VAO37_002045 [Streptococcus agalactiae]|nr:hypothetical protein [Streptococcus agalactiae]